MDCKCKLGRQFKYAEVEDRIRVISERQRDLMELPASSNSRNVMHSSRVHEYEQRNQTSDLTVNSFEDLKYTYQASTKIFQDNEECIELVKTR